MSRPAYIPASDIAAEPPSTEPLVDQPGQVDETPTVTVKVRKPFQVVHDRQHYRPDDTVEVPQHVAQRWLRNRWVTTVDQQSTDDESAPVARRGRK